MRIARVLVALVLTCLAISFVMPVGSTGTGPAEKIVLLSLVTGCLLVVARVLRLR